MATGATEPPTAGEAASMPTAATTKDGSVSVVVSSDKLAQYEVLKPIGAASWCRCCGT